MVLIGGAYHLKTSKNHNRKRTQTRPLNSKLVLLKIRLLRIRHQNNKFSLVALTMLVPLSWWEWKKTPRETCIARRRGHKPLQIHMKLLWKLKTAARRRRSPQMMMMKRIILLDLQQQHLCKSKYNCRRRCLNRYHLWSKETEELQKQFS